MKMFKRLELQNWLGTCSLAVLAILAVACGGGEQPASTPQPTGEPTAKSEPALAATSDKIVVVTPHNEFIQQEFEHAFAAWFAERNEGRQIDIEWQNRGGTGDIVKYLDASFSALGDQADDGVGIDVIFGGGTDAYENLKANGCLAVATIPEDVLTAVPAELGGVALRDPEGYWFGSALSSFGVIYNKPGLATLGLPEPKTWSDLATPAYLGHVVLADPNSSSSTRVCFEVILQKYGWEAGWAMLMEVAGNTKEFTSSSSQVPRDVAQGNAVAGMCIDFYGYTQIKENGGEVVGYVNPANATACTPDPISLLRGAPNPEVANAFITFVLSPEGQALWGLPAGTPGGPVERSLWRMAILPATFETYGDQLLVSYNPFSAEVPFNLDMDLSNHRDPLIGPLFTAAFLSNMEDLEDAWEVVKDMPEDAPLRQEFLAVPLSEEELLAVAEEYTASSMRKIELDDEWRQLFRQRYRKIIDAGK